MKYSYKKSACIGQFILVFLFSMLLLILVFFIFDLSLKRTIRTGLGLVILHIVFYSKYYKEYFEKYVELHEDSVRFNSFRFKGKMDTLSLSVTYEDVFQLGVRKLPLIGIWAITVNAKYLPHAITVSWCFYNHKELFEKLYKSVKEHNPDAYIDSRLLEYIGR